jgi:hypothetical protein
MQKNVAEQGIMGTLELQPRMREPLLFPPGEMMEEERERGGRWSSGEMPQWRVGWRCASRCAVCGRAANVICCGGGDSPRDWRPHLRRPVPIERMKRNYNFFTEAKKRMDLSAGRGNGGLWRVASSSSRVEEREGGAGS